MLFRVVIFGLFLSFVANGADEDMAPEPPPVKEAPINYKAETNKIISQGSVRLESVIQRYFMDELMSMRKELGEIKVNFIREVADRQLRAVEEALIVNKSIQEYAINVINYFFYCIAVVVSILTLVGWKSIADIKKNANQFAGSELNKLIRTYEDRLDDIENEIKEKSRFVSKNYEMVKRSNEKNAIWLRIHMEESPKNKIEFLDEILAIDKDDAEALAYKANTALQLKEYVWALDICNKALAIEPENINSLYQKACIYMNLADVPKAMKALQKAIEISPSLKRNAKEDPNFESVRDKKEFLNLVS